jgi:hypothetical protein
VLVPGRSRQRLHQTLAVAYADGLLSEETFVARVDALLADPIVEPGRITGDLFLRRRARWMTRIAERARGLYERPSGSDTLLALDWSGAGAELTIGRHTDCDIVLGEASISRRHAQLRFRDGRWILQDLCSTNGTFVNGDPVGRCELRPGDRILIGPRRLIVD